MEDRHDESQPSPPSAADPANGAHSPATAAEAAAPQASGSGSTAGSDAAAASEETLAYLRERAHRAAAAEAETQTSESGSGEYPRAAESAQRNEEDTTADDEASDEAADTEDANSGKNSKSEKKSKSGRGGKADAVIVVGPQALRSLEAWRHVEQRVRSLSRSSSRKSTRRGRPDVVMLDCEAVESVDSVGLGRLILLGDAAQERGRRLALVKVPDAVRTTLAMMGLHAVLPCYADSVAARNNEPLPPPVVETAPPPAAEDADAPAPPDEALAPAQTAQQPAPFPAGMLIETMRGDLRAMYDALVGEFRGRFREVEQIKAGFVNLGKSLNQVQAFLGEVATRVTAFEQHLNRLTSYFNERFRADKASQAAFDKLHEELKFYRDDALFRSQKPIFIDLILLYDDVGRMIRDAADEETARKFTLLRDVIVEILYRRDVEVIKERPAKFDKTFQKALKRTVTTEPTHDRTVAEVVRDGFRWGGNVLRPQEVVVRRYDLDGTDRSDGEPSEAGDDESTGAAADAAGTMEPAPTPTPAPAEASDSGGSVAAAAAAEAEESSAEQPEQAPERSASAEADAEAAAAADAPESRGDNNNDNDNGNNTAGQPSPSEES